MRHLFSIAGMAFLLDRFTKWVVRKTMFEGETIDVYRDIINLSYIKNEGITFGLLQDQGLLLISLAILIIVVILVSFRRLEHQDRWTKLGVGLILGGAGGNLFDRLRFGGVIDFLDIGLGDHRWPVFNLADVSICLGAGILVYHWKKKE